jgi:hypothetical protein
MAPPAHATPTMAAKNVSARIVAVSARMIALNSER